MLNLLFAIGLRTTPGAAEVSLPALLTLAQVERLDPATRARYLGAIQNVIDDIETKQSRRLAKRWVMPDPGRPAACLADGILSRLEVAPSPASCTSDSKDAEGKGRASICSGVMARCPSASVVQIGPHQLRCRSSTGVPCNPLVFGFVSDAREYDQARGRWTASVSKPHRGPFCRPFAHPHECVGHAQTEFIPKIVRELKVEAAYDEFANRGLSPLCAGPEASRSFDDRMCRSLSGVLGRFIEIYRKKLR